jgi:parallel beta-helix repeat protein
MHHLRILAAAVLLLISPRVFGQSNLVMLISPTGDYVGQGQSHVTTNPADFSVSGNLTTVSVSAFGYTINLDGPGATNLAVGLYTNAARYPFNGPSPGVTVSGNGRGCNTVCGAFEIFEIRTNASGQIDRLWAVHTNSCECFMPSMTGEIRLNSQLAPPAPVPKILRVPQEYATIQAALDNASLLASDTVLVSPGTYTESLNFKGRRTQLISSNGPAATFLRSPSGVAVAFGSGETSASVISGFTITNSSTGIAVSSSGTPTIVSNVIINCGTGIDVNFASPIIRSNRIFGSTGNGIALGGAAIPLIENNIIEKNARGIDMFAAGDPVIRNNRIQGNRGDGVGMVNRSDANIIQNIIVGNTNSGITWLVPSGARGPWVINNTIFRNGTAGISADGFDVSSRIINNIIIGTPALSVGGFNDNNPPQVRNNNIFSTTGAAYAGLISNLTGVAGNIAADPLFVCQPGEDFRLLPGSPCVDAGTNGAPELPSLDFQGATRIMDGDTNGSVLVDIGAYEFNPAVVSDPCLYLTCPGNITVSAPAGQNSVIVNYPAPVGTPVATLTSTPLSGSAFPGGTNLVTCTATYGTNSVSCTFLVTVIVPPTIINQPANTNVSAGQPLLFSVTATGSMPLQYRWTFEGGTIGGATASSLLIPSAQAINEGVYRAIVTNTAGSVTSSLAFARVIPAAPSIISNPVSVAQSATSNAVFSVVAGGSAPLGYRWYFNGSLVSGATASQYSITNIQAPNAGGYHVVVTNGSGSVTSVVATLQVLPLAPYFVTQPISASLVVGANRTLTGLARGSEPISYQWQRNGSSLAGATQTSFILTNLQLTNTGGYTLVASNIGGVSTSSVAQITINQPAAFTQGLSNHVVDVGADVLLSVSAVGSPSPGFSWQFNGTPLPQTNNSLSVTNIQFSQAGYYSVLVSNGFGSIISTGRVSVLGPKSFVLAWGDNSGGQTNVPADLNDVVAVAGGDFHSIALRRNGSLLGWGYNADGQTTVPTNAMRFVAIAAGGAHNLAITEAGSVVAWGRNDFGQRNVPSFAVRVLSVAAGESHSLALLSSGAVGVWGDNSLGQQSIPQGLTAVRAIAAGRNHNLALRTNGTVSAWGFNAYGQTSVPPTLTNVATITAGYLHSVALQSNGTVVVWGDNTFGQTNVPPLSNVVAVAAGNFHTYALSADGVVTGWGDNSFFQTNIPAVTDISAIAAGYYHGLLLSTVPELQLEKTATGLVINWKGSGILQAAPTPGGPFTNLTGGWQGYTNSDLSAPSVFYRLRRE